MTEPSGITHRRPSPHGRWITWGLLAAWGVGAYYLGGLVSYDMRFRVNDIEAVPNAGLIMRDPEGVFYHVNAAQKARAIFPVLAPPQYTDECFECMLVTGEQLSQTNDFCISSTYKELPKLRFEIPCETWGPINDGQKIVGFMIFLVPLLAWWILRGIARRYVRTPRRA